MKKYKVQVKDDLHAYSYHSMAAKFGRVMLYLHKDSVTRVVVLTHREFLDKL